MNTEREVNGMAKSSEAQLKSQRKYAQKTVTQIGITFHNRYDADILEVLMKQESKGGFIKDVLRDYIKEHKEKFE